MQGAAPQCAAASQDPFRLAARHAPCSLGRAEACSEIIYLTWTAYNLLRQTVYVGLREDKPAEEVRHEG
jgi:ATP-dependent DNA ligase